MIPTEEPRRAGFTKQGKPLAVAKRNVSGDRNAAVAQHFLEEVLVHAERRRRDAGSDVRDTGELEQALDSAVLAERAVQDREHHVNGAERGGRVRSQHRQRLRNRPVS